MTILITWSHVDLAFVKMLESKTENFKIYRYQHHKLWNSPQRSYFKELLNIARFAALIAWYGLFSNRVIFGHHLCRLCFLLPSFKESFYIYNELPNLNKKNILSLYDRLIFRLVNHSFVSSKSRKELLDLQGFNVDKTAIIENVIFQEIKPIYVNREIQEPKIIYIGSVNGRRFHEKAQNELVKLSEIGKSVDVYSHFIDFNFHFTSEIFQYKGEFNNAEYDDIMSKYHVGLLTYGLDNMNDLFAAPLKIYEYVNSGMKLLCISENHGLDAVQTQYPNLFVTPSELKDGIFYSDAYYTQREAFLNNAILSNKHFFHKICLL